MLNLTSIQGQNQNTSKLTVSTKQIGRVKCWVARAWKVWRNSASQSSQWECKLAYPWGREIWLYLPKKKIQNLLP